MLRFYDRITVITFSNDWMFPITRHIIFVCEKSYKKKNTDNIFMFAKFDYCTISVFQMRANPPRYVSDDKIFGVASS